MAKQTFPATREPIALLWRDRIIRLELSREQIAIITKNLNASGVLLEGQFMPTGTHSRMVASGEAILRIV